MAKNIVFTQPFIFATATEVQNNFSKFTRIAANGQDVIVKKNNKEIVRIVSSKKSKPLFTDLAGIFSDSPLRSTKDIYEDKKQNYEAANRH